MERRDIDPATLRDDLDSLARLIENGMEGQAGELCDAILTRLRPAQGMFYPLTRDAEAAMYAGIATHVRSCRLNINIRRLDLAAQNVRGAIDLFEIRFGHSWNAE